MTTVESHLLDDKTAFGQVLDHLYLAGPVVAAYLLRRSIAVVSVIAVGHLGAHYLAAAGLASVTANVTGNSMVIGMSGALTTLCSQANGANNKKEMSIVLQRAVLILALFICLPMSILWACSEPIMVSLGQNPAIAKSTKDFMLVLIPGLWALSVTQCVNMWLYAQAKTKAVATIALAMAIMHPFLLWLFIYQLGIGFLGSAVSLSLSKLIEMTILLVYIGCFSNILEESAFEWSWAAWKDWGIFLRIGMPNLMMMTEWWASEIIIFMAGALSNPEVEVGAMSIYQNLLSLFFMLPAGLREACSTIVGNALGAGKPGTARAASIISPALALTVCGLMSAAILPLRNYLGRVFTEDRAVVDLVAAVAPVLAAYVVTDGLQGAYTGVIKGVGKQGIAGPIVVFSYYAVGIPLSTYLALDLHGRGLKMGVWGLCIGTLVGTAVHAGLFMLVVHVFTDMEKEAALIGEKQKAVRAGLTEQEMSATQDSVNPLSGDSAHGMLRSEDGEEAWWDEVNFLGLERKRPGRTALARTAPAPGLLTSALRRLSSVWRNVTERTKAERTQQQLSPLQYARRKRKARAAAGSKNPASKVSAAASKYELVRAHTAALDAQDGVDEDEDYLEIDFDFI